jgi:hypothetical protein
MAGFCFWATGVYALTAGRAPDAPERLRIGPYRPTVVSASNRRADVITRVLAIRTVSRNIPHGALTVVTVAIMNAILRSSSSTQD